MHITIAFRTLHGADPVFALNYGKGAGIGGGGRRKDTEKAGRRRARGQDVTSGHWSRLLLNLHMITVSRPLAAARPAAPPLGGSAKRAQGRQVVNMLCSCWPAHTPAIHCTTGQPSWEGKRQGGLSINMLFLLTSSHPIYKSIYTYTVPVTTGQQHRESMGLSVLPLHPLQTLETFSCLQTHGR